MNIVSSLPSWAPKEAVISDRGLYKTGGNSRFTETHHFIPVSHGGTNELVNLETLCSGCHRLKHYRKAAPCIVTVSAIPKSFVNESSSSKRV